MLVYKCDRCGKVWESRSMSGIETFVSDVIESLQPKLPVVNEMLEAINFHSHHLCDDCETSFKKWFVEGKNNE